MSLLANARGADEETDLLPIRLACAGCGYELPGDEPLRLACPMARPDDDVDHVLRRLPDPARLAWPEEPDPNPFVRYRQLFYGYHRAVASGRGDGEVVELVRDLDRRVADVDGHGFSVTPLRHATALSRALHFTRDGGIWVKDETGNVSGSHKARHLFGTLLELALDPARRDERTPLAIASCGNAALAAAVVARAAGRELRVFIPTDAPEPVVGRLRGLGAVVVVARRAPGISGDPTYHRLREALAAGAVPFTCQGNLNGLAIEGGMTLGWELVDQLRDEGRALDHLVIQVGGGALASSCAQALEEAYALGALPRLPRIHTLQTRGAFPLARAHERLAAELGPTPDRDAIERAVTAAAAHRSRYMWPWEDEPRSVAAGILDDETYDWLAATRAMLLTAGEPIVVDEATLLEANRFAVADTGIDADHTGTAGLAGVIELRRRGDIGPDESVAVIFTGVRRDSPAIGGHP